MPCILHKTSLMNTRPTAHPHDGPHDVLVHSASQYGQNHLFECKFLWSLEYRCLDWQSNRADLKRIPIPTFTNKNTSENRWAARTKQPPGTKHTTLQTSCHVRELHSSRPNQIRFPEIALIALWPFLSEWVTTLPASAKGSWFASGVC